MFVSDPFVVEAGVPMSRDFIFSGSSKYLKLTHMGTLSCIYWRFSDWFCLTMTLLMYNISLNGPLPLPSQLVLPGLHSVAHWDSSVFKKYYSRLKFLLQVHVYSPGSFTFDSSSKYRYTLLLQKASVMLCMCMWGGEVEIAMVPSKEILSTLWPLCIDANSTEFKVI